VPAPVDTRQSDFTGRRHVPGMPYKNTASENIHRLISEAHFHTTVKKCFALRNQCGQNIIPVEAAAQIDNIRIIYNNRV
jgi:hypothetical protein